MIPNLWSVQDTSQTSSPISVPWRRSRHSSQVRRNNLELNSLKAFTFVRNACQGSAVHSKHCRNPFGNTQHVILYDGVKQVEARCHLASGFRHSGYFSLAAASSPTFSLFSFLNTAAGFLTTTSSALVAKLISPSPRCCSPSILSPSSSSCCRSAGTPSSSAAAGSHTNSTTPTFPSLHPISFSQVSTSKASNPCHIPASRQPHFFPSNANFSLFYKVSHFPYSIPFHPLSSYPISSHPCHLLHPFSLHHIS